MSTEKLNKQNFILKNVNYYNSLIESKQFDLNEILNDCDSLIEYTIDSFYDYKSNQELCDELNNYNYKEIHSLCEQTVKVLISLYE